MAYTKTVWETGDVITATKLNNIEGGIEQIYSTASEIVGYKIYLHNNGSAVTISDESDISSDDIILEAYPSAANGFQYFKITETVIDDLGYFAGWRCIIDKVGTPSSTSPGSLSGVAALVTTDNVVYFRLNTPAISTWEDFTYIIYIIPKESEP